jgi:5-methyltetrahydropteroyltriglutamate--homocysteine methyltransferase
MKRSESRILTTHTGSLPRPEHLIDLVYASEAGDADRTELDALVAESVGAAVAKQVEVGIDVVNDGEMSKIAFNAYAKDRLTGFGGTWQRRLPADMLEHPDMAARMVTPASRPAVWPQCVGPVAYVGTEAVDVDVANFRRALRDVQTEDSFLTAASPGAIAVVLGDGYYPTWAAYVQAIGEAMRAEYRAVVDAGFVLQLDAPDLAMERNLKFTDGSLEDFRKVVALHIDVLNAATAGLPTEQLRLHVCWGNYAGPHHRDVPLKDLLDLFLHANVGALSIEASNPRHEHEWRLFEDVKLPPDLVLIPGVIDSCSNYVEHPELVAERIVRLARLVGRENLLAGTDCGFATFARGGVVAPSVAWRKLGSLAEGAAIASRTLWSA